MENWSLAVILAEVEGVSVGIFDRSLRYVSVYGGSGAGERTVGKVVGEISDDPERVLEAAKRVINDGATIRFFVVTRGRTWDVRMVPLRVPPIGIVGGAVFAWDTTR